MTPHFPHRYVSTTTRTGHGQAKLEAPPRPPIVGGPTPELHGDPTHWSPEHLLASSIGLSLFTTFDVFAARENIAVLGWRDVVTGVLDRTSAGLALKSFTVEIEITVEPADIERARTILDRAKEYCIISKALKTPLKIEAHIWSHDQRHPVHA
ncbi:MAG: osmotically inducible protein OsmC [Deltaproteobacteria bacterium]|nr:osmotically inducible protein OsmC [Deltaproteobacteria bacterium]